MQRSATSRMGRVLSLGLGLRLSLVLVSGCSLPAEGPAGEQEVLGSARQQVQARLLLSAGWDHSLTVRSDGTVWAVGSNQRGQLGDGTYSSSSTPVQVTRLSGVVAVDTGDEHSLALRSDGTVWSWGSNYSGQLGDGTWGDRTTPVQVTGLSGVVAVAAGDKHSLAVSSKGTVWARLGLGRKR